MTPEMAAALARRLGTSVELWLNLQRGYEADRGEQSAHRHHR